MSGSSDVAGLTISLLNTEGQIDWALDNGNRRAFKLWCQRRASLAARLQRLLITLATNGTVRV